MHHNKLWGINLEINTISKLDLPKKFKGKNMFFFHRDAYNSTSKIVWHQARWLHVDPYLERMNIITNEIFDFPFGDSF